MATITESSGVLPDAIDAIADTAIGLEEWSDADTAVTTDGGTTDYVDNGRVLEHGPSGMYVGLFIVSPSSRLDSNNNYTYGSGIRVVHSTDWDTDTNSPAGNTDVISADPWSGDVGNDRSSSFEYHSTDYGYDNASHGIYCHRDNPGISTLQGLNVTYFGCVTSETLNLGVWDTSTQYGAAGYYSFEYVTDKFWNDGNQPWAAWSNSTPGSSSGQFYSCSGSWQMFHGQLGAVSGTEQSRIYTGQGFDASEWGMVNPTSDDDTFFFRRPTLYQSSSTSVPVAYIEGAIGNDVNEGGAHGDTIEHNGETYRVFRQSGNAEDLTISAALRYE